MAMWKADTGSPTVLVVVVQSRHERTSCQAPARLVGKEGLTADGAEGRRGTGRREVNLLLLPVPPRPSAPSAVSPSFPPVKCVRRELNPYLLVHSQTCRSRYTTDTVSDRHAPRGAAEGEGVEPSSPVKENRLSRAA